MNEAETGNSYDRLIGLLEEGRATFRIIEHAPEGRTDVVSKLRGHNVAEAAKCIIVMLKFGKKDTRFLLAVVPGDRRLDLAAIRTLKGATYAGFAPPDRAQQLARSVMGTVLPFALDPRLELVADIDIRNSAEIYFNAARLDRSIALATDDYVRLAKPRFERISVAGGGGGG